MADKKSRDFFGSDVHGVDRVGCSRKELDRDERNPYISNNSIRINIWVLWEWMCEWGGVILRYVDYSLGMVFYEADLSAKADPTG